MVRSTLAVLLGLLVALATMLLLEYIGMSLFPLPPGVTLETEEDLARLVASASPGKLAWVLMGWTFAALAGGWAATRAGRRRTGEALAVGALIVAGVLANAAMLPPPAWMTTLGVLLPLPAAWLGARLARPRAVPTTP